MEQNVFTAGIEHGGLTTDYEIKMLLCFLLYQIGVPMTLDQMNTALQSEGLVNYFEFAEAINLLTNSGHITAEDMPDGGQLMHLNDIGVRTAKTFEKTIPLSVREKAVQSARYHMLKERIMKENHISFVKTEDGYNLSLCITDVGTDLLSLSIFVPTEDRCKEIKKRFLANPTAIYQGIVSVLMLEDLSGEEKTKE